MTTGVPFDSAGFVRARRHMVETQLVARGIRDERVLAAMLELPRHLFVEPRLADQAYADCALPAAEGQTLSQPWIVARMLELARLEAGHRVLEIGTGTGYQAALLSRLAHEVISVERLAVLLPSARARLDQLGCANVTLGHGDGSLGWRELAPYARVVAAAAAPHVPEALRNQLEAGGMLVLPVGGASSQRLEVWSRRGERFECERHAECRFVPLIGQDAWHDDPHQN